MQKVFEFVDEFSRVNNIGDANIFGISLVVEEIFTNMVKYNKAGRSDIGLNLEIDGESIIIDITDFDSDRFDITQFVAPDVNKPLMDRKIGKLGIHLVKSMVDSIDYIYNNRTSIIKMVKHLES